MTAAEETRRPVQPESAAEALAEPAAAEDAVVPQAEEAAPRAVRAAGPPAR